METIKVLSVLLSYPNLDVHQNTNELADILKREAVLNKKQLNPVLAFIDDYQQQDLLTLQENFVSTFDRSRNHCLNLFEHIHGESRDRGQAMVDLVDIYAEKGLYIDKKELPDYLPIFLEYLSMCNDKEAQESLGDVIDIVAFIGASLKKDKSDYSVIFNALEDLSNIKANQFKVAQAVAGAPQDPQTYDELDKLWEEQAAFSGEESEDCNSCDTLNSVH